MKPSTTQLYVMVAIAAVAIAVGCAVDSWQLESPVSPPDGPGWLGPLALVLFLVQASRRDRGSGRHLLRTAGAVTVLFAAGLALVIA